MKPIIDLRQKLDILMALAAHDHEGTPSAHATHPLPPRLRHANEVGALRPLNLRPVRFGQGQRATLLRILMTNACSFNCHYCPMRRDRAMPRTLLKPDELVPRSFSRRSAAAGAVASSSPRVFRGGRCV